MRRRAEPSKRAAAACLAALLRGPAGGRRAGPASRQGHVLPGQRTHADRRRQPGRPVGALVGARAAEGHAFGSHTYDHVYWQGDLPDGKFRVKPSAGPQTGKVQTWTAQQYCEEIKRSSARFTQMTGHAMLPLYRAPGGKTSPALLKAARECGYEHVGWAQAGFLGDELPSDKFPNARLLEQALRNIKPTGHAMLPCTARRAARPRRRCSRRRANAATSTWAGRRPVSWATSCPATNSTPACWSRRCEHQARRHPAGPPGHLVAPGPWAPPGAAG